jgi:hypothetical protein
LIVAPPYDKRYGAKCRNRIIFLIYGNYCAEIASTYVLVSCNQAREN